MASVEHHEALTDPYGRLTRRYKTTERGKRVHAATKAILVAAALVALYSAYEIHTYRPNVFALQ